MERRGRDSVFDREYRMEAGRPRLLPSDEANLLVDPVRAKPGDGLNWDIKLMLYPRGRRLVEYTGTQAIVTVDGHDPVSGEMDQTGRAVVRDVADGPYGLSLRRPVVE